MNICIYNERVKKYEKNTKGKDYVVGDVHGCYDLLMRGLDKINFDETKDRMFFVGDVIDRGNKNLELLKLFEKDCFISVRGNHENFIIDCHQNDEFRHKLKFSQIKEKNGSKWFDELSESEKNYALNIMRDFPIMIEIETETGLVGIVHADVPLSMDWEEFKEEIEKNDDYTFNLALLSRKRVENFIEKEVNKISKVFVGHHPVKTTLNLANIFFIDLGAVFGYNLCIVDISAKDEDILNVKAENNLAIIKS